MKKVFTLLLFFALITPAFIVAQDLVFMRGDQVLENGATIVIDDEADITGTIPSHIVVKNQTGAGIEAIFTVTVLEEAVGGMIGFCGWGTDLCLPVVYGAPASRTATVNGNQTLDPDVEAMNVEENALIKTEYKLTYGASVSSIYVTFVQGGTSVAENTGKENMKILTGENSLTMLYDFSSILPYQVEIYNLTGTKVFSASPSVSAKSLYVDNLNKGLYICTLKQSGKVVSSQKVIIR